MFLTASAEALAKEDVFQKKCDAQMNIDIHKLFDKLKYDPSDPLLFNSGFFLIFFAVFFTFYIFVYKHKLTRVVLFTLFSLYFFYKACGWYFVFILISAVADFGLSNLIHLAKAKSKKKILLIISIVLNLGLLFTFKYTDFFIGIVNDVTHGTIKPLHLILPVGISFYTFENLSYTIDVYRGEFKPVKSFVDYCFFLTFFPKLMMGPIVRAKDFIPQIRQELKLNDNDVARGLFLITSGLFKKIVISDYLSTHIVDNVFENPCAFTGLECLFAVYGYALVIYCDFSGYSEMAIGMAKWMGFNIPDNFNSPYQSSSITEFWRRWHISLSSWLKDYVYIPLGGNKNGKLKQYGNLFITMLIGGFWHGASWNFIFWGALQGIALAIDKLKMEFFGKYFPDKKSPNGKILKVIGIIFTFHFVCFCWIFFKSENFTAAGEMISRIKNEFHFELFLNFLSAYSGVIVVLLIGFVLHFTPEKISLLLTEKLSVSPFYVKLIWFAGFIWIAIQFKNADPILPVYLQF